jgi:hypothetical protein
MGISEPNAQADLMGAPLPTVDLPKLCWSGSSPASSDDSIERIERFHSKRTVGVRRDRKSLRERKIHLANPGPERIPAEISDLTGGRPRKSATARFRSETRHA